MTLSIIQLNTWAASNFSTAHISFLSVIVKCYSLTGLKIILPLCSLLSFLHNRTPCEHNNKLNAWMVDNLAPLDMLCPYYSMLNKSKNHTSTFIYYLLFCKNGIYFYLEVNWSGQNQSNQTASADPDWQLATSSENIMHLTYHPYTCMHHWEYMSHI